MRFKDDLWTEDDPLYAPGKVPSRDNFYWTAPRKYQRMGYEPARIRLTGKEGDGKDLIRAKECREHTKQMLHHFGVDNPFGLDTSIGTWGWLIRKWKSDPHARYCKVKANTRAMYDHFLDRWDQIIGKAQISAMTYVLASDILAAMKDKGRSQDNMARMFAMLRTLARYGKAIGVTGADKAEAAIGQFRFDGSPARTAAPTRDQIEAIIAEAQRRDLTGFATGLLFQWTYALRAVDVRGQWLSDPHGAGGIARNGKRWQDGLTWDMIAPDMQSFAKVISKTKRSMPEPAVYPITPKIREALLQTPADRRTGPIILNTHGEPYTRDGWHIAWRRLRDALDLPKELQVRDVRAGAITEAKRLGADPTLLRDAAGHASIDMTTRYARDRADGAANVIKLRNV
jgi:hypothetical protein